MKNIYIEEKVKRQTSQKNQSASVLHILIIYNEQDLPKFRKVDIMTKAKYYDTLLSVLAVILMTWLDKFDNFIVKIAIALFYLIMIIYFYKERIVVKWFYQKYSNKIKEKYFDAFLKIRFWICVILGYCLFRIQY